MKNYRPLPEFLTIKKSNIDGLGLFATRTILPETYMGISHILTIDGGEEKIHRTPVGGFINHSKNPNCSRIKDGNYWLLFSKRHIEKDEELTLEYSMYDPTL
jgi:SET domain-containing protein